MLSKEGKEEVNPQKRWILYKFTYLYVKKLNHEKIIIVLLLLEC